MLYDRRYEVRHSVRAGVLAHAARAFHHQHVAAVFAAGVPQGGVRAAGYAEGAASGQHEDRGRATTRANRVSASLVPEL